MSATDSLVMPGVVLKPHASESPEGSVKDTSLTLSLLILGKPTLLRRVAAAAGSGTTLKNTGSGSDA